MSPCYSYAIDVGAGPEELKGYIEHLIAKLLEVIAGGTPDSQETALGALASAANAAGTSFQPFVGAVFPVLRQFMEVTAAFTVSVRHIQRCLWLLPSLSET